MFRKITHGFLILALAGYCTLSIAQESASKSSRAKASPAKASPAKASAAKASAAKVDSAQSDKGSAAPAIPGGRLPRFFASLVDDEQRQQMYEIRESYRPQIEALEKQLDELRAKELTAMEKVLTAAQRKQLAEMREAAEKPTKAKTSEK
jgi:Spy/CpxP family protein refolding chaperone